MPETTSANPMIGSLIFALGGLAGAVFAVPFRKIKNVQYESYWLFYALAGLLVFPLILGLATCPACFKVIGGAKPAVLAQCIGFGALWGLGGLTWGLMIRYLGIGLGLAIGCGLCSATGTLIPPIVTGHAGDLVKDAGACTVLAGVVGSLLGIALVGLAGKFKEGELTEEQFGNYLYSAGISDPDLLIRPGGEQRISNFLLWQCAYSEFYFTDVLWPDFSSKELDRAIAEYQRRDRRFGKVK